MRPFPLPNPIRYTARIVHVREVSISGTADLACWQRWLQPLALSPATNSGATALRITASALVWQGLHFREVIVSVSTTTGADPAHADSFYLADACTSSPILAWAERLLFQTPYVYRAVTVDSTAPLIEVRQRGQPVLRAQLGQPRAPGAHVRESWHGPVFLPVSHTRQHRGRPYLVVAIQGEQAVSPFDPVQDHFTIAPAADHPLFAALRDSHFTPTEWRICANATHARSQTYWRSTTR